MTHALAVAKPEGDEDDEADLILPERELSRIVEPLDVTPEEEDDDEIAPPASAAAMPEPAVHVAACRIVSVPVALEGDERRRYRQLRARFAAGYGAFQRVAPDAAWSEFVRASSRTVQGRAALAAWQDYRALLAYPRGKRAALRALLVKHRGSRALVVTADNATAYAIARELLVMPITHEIGRAERRRALDEFRAGKLPVLVSSQLLDEGPAMPEADLAIVVGGASTARRDAQRIGRVLWPRDGTRALIYELAVSDTTEARRVAQRRADRGQLALGGVS